MIKKSRRRRLGKDKLFEWVELRRRQFFVTCFQCKEEKSRASFPKNSKICNSCLQSSSIQIVDVRHLALDYSLNRILDRAAFNPSANHFAPDLLTPNQKTVNVLSSAQQPCWDFKINLNRPVNFILMFCFEINRPCRIFLIPFWKFEWGILPHRLRLCRHHFEKFNQFDIRFRKKELEELNGNNPIPILKDAAKTAIFL